MRVFYIMFTKKEKDLLYLRLKQNKVKIEYKELLVINDLDALNQLLISRGFLITKNRNSYYLHKLSETGEIETYKRKIELNWNKKIRNIELSKFLRYYGFSKSETPLKIKQHEIEPSESIKAIASCIVEKEISKKKISIEKRTIYSIDKDDAVTLKVQKAIDNLLYEMFQNILSIPCIQAYSSKRSNITNAEQHLGYKYCLKSDVENYFESIDYDLFEKILLKRYESLTVNGKQRNFDKDLLDIIKRYCFITNESNRSFLPQGYCTSPVIANIVGYYEIDEKIMHYINKVDNNIVYTRYSDDITISTNDEATIEQIVTKFGKINEYLKFSFREDKTFLYKPGDDHKRITGIQVGNRLSISNRKIKKVSSGLQNVINHSDMNKSLAIKEVKKLKAQLIYYNKVDNLNKRVIREIYMANKQLITINNLFSHKDLSLIMRNTIYYGNLNLITFGNEKVITFVYRDKVYFTFNSKLEDLVKINANLQLYWEVYFKKGRKQYLIDINDIKCVTEVFENEKEEMVYCISKDKITGGDNNVYITPVDSLDEYVLESLTLVLKLKYCYIYNNKKNCADYEEYLSQLTIIIKNIEYEGKNGR